MLRRIKFGFVHPVGEMYQTNHSPYNAIPITGGI